LHFVDATFSGYRVHSDISRLARGDLELHEADPHVTEVLDLCTAVAETTGGFFTATPAGVIDPTGLVKGWAIERASELLRLLGAENHAINGGGDIQVAGEPEPGRPWTVAISDPRDRTRVLTTLALRDAAVATSGSTERGRHIIDPRTGAGASGLLSATIIGPGLSLVDAYATAGFAMGAAAISWVSVLPGYEAFLVTDGGLLHATAGWSSYTLADAA
jgi:thiamine biosynthesis lipoprotein